MCGEYQRAFSRSETITQRLMCINNTLKDDPPPPVPFSGRFRKRVLEALEKHMRECQGESLF